jgi:hypothetical protein
LVSIPAGLFAYEVISSPERLMTDLRRWLWPALSCFVLVIWFFIYGGSFGPKSVVTDHLTHGAGGFFHMPYVLYGLACLGLYFVIFESALWKSNPGVEFKKSVLVIGAVLAALFIVFPPVKNPVWAPMMGFLDVSARYFLKFDALRMILYWALASLAAVRFFNGRRDVVFWLVGVQAIIFGLSEVAWDKYALPLLCALWFLKARLKNQPALLPVWRPD